MWPLFHVLLLCSSVLHASKRVGENGSEFDEPNAKRVKLVTIADAEPTGEIVIGENSISVGQKIPEIPSELMKLEHFEAHLNKTLEGGFEVGDTWYIVSERWINDWKNWCLEEVAKDPSKTFKPMNNADIIDWESFNLLPDHIVPIRTMLEEDVDYRLLPESTWKLLQDWYGTKGPVIKRSMILYPHGELSAFAHMPEIEFIYGNQEVQEIFKVCHLVTVKQLKELIRTHIAKVKPEIALPETLYYSHHWYDAGIEFALNEDLDDVTVFELNLGAKDCVVHVGTAPSETALVNELKAFNEIIRSNTGSLTGLRNLGNTCYMNSALQCLIHCQPFRNMMFKIRAIVSINAAKPYIGSAALFKQLQQLTRNAWSAPYNHVLDTSLFKFWFDYFNKDFTAMEQHDSSEFLSLVLNLMHSNMCFKGFDRSLLGDQDSNVRSVDRARTPVSETFQGSAISTLTCGACKGSSTTDDSFFILSLPIPVVDDLTAAVFIQSDKKMGEIELYFGVESEKTVGSLKRAVLDRLALSHEEFEVKLIEQREDEPWRIVEVPDDEPLSHFSSSWLHAGVALLGVEHTWMLFSIEGAEVGFPLLVPTKEGQLLSSLIEFSQNPDLQQGNFKLLSIGQHAVKIEIDRSVYMKYLNSAQEVFHRECPMKAFQNMLLNKYEILNRTTSPHGITLDSCLEKLLKAEMLEPEDTWLCPNCNAKADGTTKQFQLANLPNVFIVQLKRFAASGKKLSTPIEFTLGYKVIIH